MEHSFERIARLELQKTFKFYHIFERILKKKRIYEKKAFEFYFTAKEKKNCKQNNAWTIVVITSCVNFFFGARAFVVMQKKYHNLVGIVKITLMGRTEICMYRLCLFFKKTVDILIRVRRENQ